jgi:hypothetical protein
METMRSTWTDERLDDLAHRMDKGFDRVDTDIRELRSEMNVRFDSMQRGMDARFDSMHGSIVGMQRTMIGMMATIVVGFLVTNL